MIPNAVPGMRHTPPADPYRTRKRIALWITGTGFLLAALGSGSAVTNPDQVLMFMSLSCAGFSSVIVGGVWLTILYSRQQHEELMGKLGEVSQLRAEVAELRRRQAADHKTLSEVVASMATLKSLLAAAGIDVVVEAPAGQQAAQATGRRHGRGRKGRAKQASGRAVQVSSNVVSLPGRPTPETVNLLMRYAEKIVYPEN